MRFKTLVAATLLCLAGCEEVSPASAPQAVQAQVFKYRITQYFGANDLAIRSQTYLVNDWSFMGDGWILLEMGKDRRVWLSGTIEIEEGSFREKAR